MSRKKEREVGFEPTQQFWENRALPVELLPQKKGRQCESGRVSCRPGIKEDCDYLVSLKDAKV